MSTESILKISNADIFQREALVLKNVNLEIRKGEFVYIIGKTGSGKSSLLRTLYADLPLTSGDGVVAGFHLNSIKTREIPYLRRKIGIVFQDFQLLLDRNVGENLRFVMTATGWKNKVEMDNRIQELLNSVGMGAKGYKMPYQLSGGEQQRVAIARALINDPELILADEPTGNLDPITSEEIMTLLKRISDTGKAVFMATHDYSIIRKFPSRILKCEDGAISDLRTSAEKA